MIVKTTCIEAIFDLGQNKDVHFFLRPKKIAASTSNLIEKNMNISARPHLISMGLDFSES